MISFSPHHILTILLPLFLAVTGLHAQEARTPPAGSEVRKAIMDAIRPRCEEDLKRDVIFVVEKLKVEKGWAYAVVTPQTPDGKKIDYRGTKFQKRVADGTFDGTGQALLRRQADGAWGVLEWELGRTDVAIIEWINKYNAPSGLDG